MSKTSDGKRKLQGMKKQLYSNCVILDPSGGRLCRADEKKANWYLVRNLAEKVADEPLTIRLLFEPGGKGDVGDEYMLAEKSNRCVVCGNENDLSRHHVVPLRYKVHFPERAKRHCSYDVFPVCIHCHAKYEDMALALHREIFAELGLSEKEKLFPNDQCKAFSAANAIRVYGDRIPKQRMDELTARIRAYLGREPTIEDMDSLRANLYGSRHAEDLLGRQVVEKVVDLDDFAQRWRRHFVVSMKPGFLPKEWKIDKKAYSAPVVQ